MDQKTYDKAHKHLEIAIKLLGDLEKESCDKAGACTLTADANAFITRAAGAAKTAKGLATQAGNVSPDISPAFGGK